MKEIWLELFFEGADNAWGFIWADDCLTWRMHETRDIYAVEDDTHDVIQGMAGHAAQNVYTVESQGRGCGVVLF
jgi:hypothetical protein